jgi:hypothetical protein
VELHVLREIEYYYGIGMDSITIDHVVAVAVESLFGVECWMQRGTNLAGEL